MNRGASTIEKAAKFYLHTHLKVVSVVEAICHRLMHGCHRVSDALNSHIRWHLSALEPRTKADLAFFERGQLLFEAIAGRMKAGRLSP